MEIIKQKKAQIGQKLNKPILVIVTVVVLVAILANLMPEAQNAGDSMSDATRCGEQGFFFNTSQTECLTNSSLEGIVIPFEITPLASVFGGGGIIILLMMVVFFIVILRIIMPSKNK